MPTIDPNDYTDAGTLGDNELSGPAPPIDPGLSPPGSPGWTALQQRIGMDTDAEEDRHVRAQKVAAARIDALNRGMHLEADAHRQELARTAAKQQLELEQMLGALPKSMALHVRMQAYLRALDASHGNSQERQLHADQLALKIARYMVEGRAE